MELLEIDRRQLGDWTAVALRGQLDVATAPLLRQELLETHHAGAAAIVIDLAGVEYLDSMGLGVLVGALKRARAHGGRLVIAGPTPHVQRALELSRVAEIIEIVDRVEDLEPP